MTPSDRLQAGVEATNEHRFEEALESFVWFHDHALKENHAYAGVRLSFALMYWLDLAKVYPPALEKFIAYRDAKVESIRLGDGSFDLFHDVSAMNESLGDDASTVDLFEFMDKHSYELTPTCAHLALPALVRTRTFDLAAKYMLEPISHALRLAQQLVRDIQEIEEHPRSSSPQYDAFIHIFADEIKLLRTVLTSTGRTEQADGLLLSSLNAITIPQVRNAASRLIAGDASQVSRAK